MDTAAAYTLGTKHSLSSEKLGGGKDSFQWILYYIKSPKQDAKSRAQIKHMEHGFINPRPVTARRFQQRLTNLREHLAFLESQLPAGTPVTNWQ